MSPSRGALRSWGNYPDHPQEAIACRWRAELPDRLAEALRDRGSTLPYGSGLSYGDSCLAQSDCVIRTRPLDRFIAADWLDGVVTAEAGVTLEEILRVAIPHGWFLAVAPGTRRVTLGGAIANDVHGKNHHRRGTFGACVQRLGLYRSDAGRLVCSAAEQQALFQATIGGLGLTGIIEWAQIQLVPIRTSDIEVTTQRFEHLDEFFALSEELDRKHEFCVSWVDCAAAGRRTGRGVYTAGSFAAEGRATPAATRQFTVPVTPPFPVVNRLTLRPFNDLYWRRAPRDRQTRRMGYARFLFPLDRILGWNRLYGRRGFQQYQCLIPEADARAGIQALLGAIARSGTGSFLAVLKRCGDLPSPGLLSFPRVGTTLALDFPQTEELGPKLLAHLDAIVREAGGRLYPAKDAHMSGADFRRSYPAWEQLEALRDPALMSRFWKRVTG